MGKDRTGPVQSETLNQSDSPKIMTRHGLDGVVPDTGSIRRRGLLEVLSEILRAKFVTRAAIGFNGRPAYGEQRHYIW